MSNNINRQAAIDALGEAPEVWTDSPEEFAALNQWEMDVVAIKAVPSADHTGKWEHDVDGHFFCTNCKKYPEYQVRMSDYCPNCGAKMVREDGKA